MLLEQTLEQTPEQTHEQAPAYSHTWDTCILGILGYLYICILEILGYLDTWDTCTLGYLDTCKIDTCFGLPWSTLICLGLLALFLITIERLKCSKAISGMDWMGISVGTDSKSTALRC